MTTAAHGSFIVVSQNNRLAFTVLVVRRVLCHEIRILHGPRYQYLPLCPNRDATVLIDAHESLI